jgi:hypothetical protein
MPLNFAIAISTSRGPASGTSGLSICGISICLIMYIQYLGEVILPAIQNDVGIRKHITVFISHQVSSRLIILLKSSLMKLAHYTTGIICISAVYPFFIQISVRNLSIQAKANLNHKMR